MLRKLKKFEYRKPKNVEEVVCLLEKHHKDAKILAGGTDLLVAMKKGVCTPRHIINLKGVKGLDQIEYSEEERALKIGALVTIASLLRSQVVKDKFSLLWEGSSLLASPQVKNMATVGGNICNASPAADLPPALIALGAEGKICGPHGERKMPIEDIFKGPGKTVLQSDELLAEVKVPLPSRRALGKYTKYNPGRMSDLAFVNVATLLEMKTGTKTCNKARIVLGAVAEIPMRAFKAEEYLQGKVVNENTIDHAGTLASEEARPIDDLRGSAWYRREMVKILVQKNLKEMTGKF
ncbi:FAD binding domain-containing protein [Thermodesulfobacteriota bacterium]